MKTSQAGLDFITANEGCVLTAYRDSVGVLTVGYGHTGPEVTLGLVWSQEQAMEALQKDVAKVEMTLNALAPDNCTQNQFDALVDFGFNLGTGALQTMLSHGWREVPLQLPRWNKGHVGDHVVELAGLTARRQREVDLFNTP